MTEFKVGDVIENVRDIDDCGPSHIAIGDRFTVTEVSGTSVYFADKMNCPRYRPYRNYKLISRTPETPPATITHEGYTYTRGERVHPEWLKDGAWVVNVGTGDLRQVKEVSPGVFDLTAGTIISIRYGDHIRDQYRPHEPSDYKWGDWAMYEGKKVFVMGREKEGYIFLSHPSWVHGYAVMPVSNITPPHAP